MSGHDFDHNGRTNSRDYYIYSSVCSDEDSNSSAGKATSSGSSFGAVDVKLWLALIYFFTWIKGTLGFGFIASTLGLISGIYLFLRLMAWAYS